jgi:hypothetical protein
MQGGGGNAGVLGSMHGAFSAARMPAEFLLAAQAATPVQQSVMTQIISASQQENPTMVANLLTQAIGSRVSLPPAFLTWIKDWMDRRRQQHVAPALRPPVAPPVQAQVAQIPYQASAAVLPAAAPAAPAAPQVTQMATQKNSAFFDLHSRLEQAISRGDQEAMKTILEEAARVAAQRMVGGAVQASAPAPAQAPPAQPTSRPTPSAVAASTPKAPPPALPQPLRQPPRPTHAPSHRDIAAPDALDFEDDSGHVAEPVQVEFPDHEVKEHIRKILEQSQDKQAPFTRLNSIIKVKAARLRTIVESDKGSFSVFNKGQNVRLIDEASRKVMSEFRKLLMKAGRGPGLVSPATAAATVPKLVKYALQANAMDVALQLLALKQVILRRQKGATPFGMLSSNTPLLLACLVDQIIVEERRQGDNRSFEMKLGSIIHSLIFQGWVMGNTPGSQFLTNVLLTWGRLGYFEPQQLQKCKESLMLLVQYAPIEGVPDAPDKPRGTGWYAVVKRAPHKRQGCEAINPEASDNFTPADENKDDEPKDEPQVRPRTAMKMESLARTFVDLSGAPSDHAANGASAPPAKRQRSEPGITASA